MTEMSTNGISPTMTISSSSEGDFHCELVEEDSFLVVCPPQQIRKKQEDNLKMSSQSNGSPVTNVNGVKKLAREFARIHKMSPPGISVSLSDENNLYEWEAIMVGPEDSPFAGGTFRLRISFPKDYPTSPPRVCFLTEMFHPNVFAEDGRVCIDILQNAEKWKPEYGIATVLVAIQILLGEPNPLSPANCEAGDLYQTDFPEYSRKVRYIVRRSETYRKLSDAETKMNFNTIKSSEQPACVIM